MAHRIAEGELAHAWTAHDHLDARQRRAREADLAGEEAREPLGLAVAGVPAPGRRQRDDAAGASALGEFERERASERVAHDVRGVHRDFVEVALEVVGSAVERHRVPRLVGRAAVMTGERRRDHFVPRHQVAQQRAPVVPGAREPVQQQDRLARAGAIQPTGDLAHARSLQQRGPASSVPMPSSAPSCAAVRPRASAAGPAQRESA